MSDYFLNGTYTGNDGIVYNVAQLAQWACDPATIRSGAACLRIVKLTDLKHGITNEMIGSPEFVRRMKAATLLDPLIVTSDFDIIDGVHRLYKARGEWLEELLAYVVDAEQFPASARAS